MPNKCVVRRCDGRGGFTFPSDPELRSEWLSAIRRSSATTSSWKPTPYSTVCESHFKPEDFASALPEGKRKRRVLWKGAVPSVFQSSSASSSSSKKESPMLATNGNVEDGYANIMEPEVKIKVEESGDTSEVGEVTIEPPYRSGIAFVSYVRGERTGDGEVLKATKQAKVRQGMLS